MQKARILVVDDDSYGLIFFRSSLATLGFEVVTTHNADEAESIIRREGSEAYQTVLTDYRMPRRTGLDLLKWIQEFDSSLATVIVTAEGEKELVQLSLRNGAADYIEKPVSVALLGETVKRAVQTTRRNRKLLTTDREVRAAGQIHFIFQPILVPRLSQRMSYFLKSLDEVGGDFFNALPVEENRSLIVAGDVSGHSVRSGFISAYFQGLTRGLSQDDRHSLTQTMEAFNRILNHERHDAARSGTLSPPLSLSITAAMLDEKAGKLELLSAGAPPWTLVGPDGELERAVPMNPPLGWISNRPLRSVMHSLSDWRLLFLYSDGLGDLSDKIGVDSYSLAYRLLSEAELENEMLANAPDDILVIRIMLNDAMTVDGSYQPLIVEQYSGSEYVEIDRLQEVWRRSLQFSLGDRVEARLYEVLLCCREGVLNAMQHGCDGSPDKVCHFSVSYHGESGTLRVRIDDPGVGHAFDIEERVRQLTTRRGEHLGLALIDDLSDKLATENAGSSLVFDISLK